VEPPRRGSKLPAVRLTLPDGTVVTSEQPEVAQILSKALGREVAFAEARGDGESSGAQAEEYWPDMDGLEYSRYRDRVGAAGGDVLRSCSRARPHDCDDRSSADVIAGATTRRGDPVTLA